MDSKRKTDGRDIYKSYYSDFTLGLDINMVCFDDRYKIPQ